MLDRGGQKSCTIVQCDVIVPVDIAAHQRKTAEVGRSQVGHDQFPHLPRKNYLSLHSGSVIIKHFQFSIIFTAMINCHLRFLANRRRLDFVIELVEVCLDIWKLGGTYGLPTVQPIAFEFLKHIK